MFVGPGSGTATRGGANKLGTAASGPSGHPQSTADESRGRAAACRREGQSLARSPGLCHSGMQLKS